MCREVSSCYLYQICTENYADIESYPVFKDLIGSLEDSFSDKIVWSQYHFDLSFCQHITSNVASLCYPLHSYALLRICSNQ